MKLILRMFASIITILLSVYILLCIGLYFFQEKLIYFPDNQLVNTPSLDFNDVYLTSSEGKKIHGWYIDHENPRAYVLFFHGNAGNISHRPETIKIFNELGLATLIIDYQGYGLSEGQPTEKGSYDDALAAWKYLIDEKNIKAEYIIVFGRSLGGGVASWLANEKQPGLTILESTFSSITDIGKETYPFLPVKWLTRIQYNSKEHIKTINSPVLIIHSQHDEIIPFEHGQLLFNLAKEPKEFHEIQGGHNGGFLINRESYKNALANFIDKHL